MYAHDEQYAGSSTDTVQMSIAPGNVAANTYNTALAIGEKAAVIIAKELGIQNV